MNFRPTNPRGFQVRISPDAWRALGSVSRESFRDLQRELNRIAAVDPAEIEVNEVLVALNEGELTARFRIDLEARTVSVAELIPKVSDSSSR